MLSATPGGFQRLKYILLMCKPHLGFGTSYIVPISVFSGAGFLLPLTLQPDSTKGYFSNTIDFKAFDLFDMYIVQLDA
jgi:hypothetical protein